MWGVKGRSYFFLFFSVRWQLKKVFLVSVSLCSEEIFCRVFDGAIAGMGNWFERGNRLFVLMIFCNALEKERLYFIAFIVHNSLKDGAYFLTFIPMG